VVEGNFLDLFAGTGAVGIEALSRGAKLAFFVEMSRPAVALIRQNLERTGFTDRAEVYAMEVIRAINLFHAGGAVFDVIYLGAPYESPALEKALAKLTEVNILKNGGIIVAEHRKQHLLADNYGAMEKKRDARYGETILSFYKAGQ
jgi:16S rRNA (guanine(966)-N(2))-methyltransferase RsmD